MLFKGEVIHEEQEARRTSADQGGDGRQIGQVFLAHLDQPQAALGIGVGNGLHRGGLPGARRAIEQGIVRGQPGQKALHVCGEQSLLALVAH